MIADLFVNFSIVISLVFIYMQVRWKTHKKLEMPGLSVVIDGLSGGFMGILLMYYAIPLSNETIMDFRYIPIMLLILFVGKRSAAISSLVIIAGRFYIGVSRAAIYAIFMISILFAGYLILSRLLRNEERMMRKGLYFTLYSNVVFTYFLIIMVGEYTNIIAIIFLFCLTSLLGGMASVYLVNYIRNSEYLFNKYQLESSTDFLTGLSNVRRFEDYWNKVATDAKNNQNSCAIMLIDIDRFKMTNDTYGHAAGDYVLVELGRLMEDTIGERGSAFRKGGEEFAVVLPNCDKAQALVLAETLRMRVEQQDFMISSTVRTPVTVSIGVTVYPETINQLKDMIEMAVALLYKSKNEGRNRVSV